MWGSVTGLLSGKIAGDVNVTSGACGDGGAGVVNCDPAITMQMTAATARPAKTHLTTDQLVLVDVVVGPAGSAERWLAAGLMLSIFKSRNGGNDRRRNERRIRTASRTSCHCSTLEIGTACYTIETRTRCSVSGGVDELGPTHFGSLLILHLRVGRLRCPWDRW